MAAGVLSVAIQTKVMRQVMEPIESQVEQLVVVNDTRYKDGSRMPNLVPSAQRVIETTDRLSATAERIAVDSNDEQLLSGIKPGIEHLNEASRGMLKASKTLKMNSLDRTARATLIESARGVLEGTLKLLLECDSAEVRRIVQTAQLVMDKVAFVEGVQSMHALVVCFKGFSDCVLELANLANKRQRQLVNPRQRERIVTALSNLKRFVPMFSDCMQRFIKYQTNPQAKASRDYVVGQIMLDVMEIIRAVESEAFRDELEPGLVASSMNTLQQRLGPGSRHAVTSELEQYMEAIVRNSMAVAHFCSDAKREEIIQSCHEVAKLKQELSECLNDVQANPNSQQARDKFDAVADLLCQEFRLLDHLVNSAVVQQVANVFVETAAPMHKLVGAATSPARQVIIDPARQLAEHIETFKNHNTRLIQVASSAAAGSQDARRVHVIRVTASEIDKLTPQIVSAAVAVRRNTEDLAAREHLEMLRKEWASKVQLLTATIDEITDKGDFMAEAEGSIRQEVAHCRDAIAEGDPHKLELATQAITGRSRRIVEVANAEILNSDDPHFHNRLQTGTSRLEAAIPLVAAGSNRVMGNLYDVQAQKQFAESTRELVDSVRGIRDVLQGNTVEVGSGFVDGELERPLMFTHGESGSYIRSAERVITSPYTSSPLYQDVASRHQITSQSPSFEVESISSYKPKARDESGIQEKKMLLTGPTRSPAAAAVEQLERSAVMRSGLEQRPRPRSSEVGSQTELSFISDASTGMLSQVALERLVSAAQSGLLAEVDAESAAIRNRGDVLISLANAAANSSSDRDKIRLVHVISSEIEKLVPQLVDAARVVNKDPSNAAAVERLKVLGRTWAEKVNTLTATVDSMVAPWSAVVIRLSKAALASDTAGLNEHTEGLKMFTERVSSLAAAAVEAADAEDSVDLSSGESGVAALRDPAAAKRVEVLQTLSGQIEKMMPQLISTARKVAVSTSDQAAVEQFEILCRDWAGKVKALVVAVDDITVGTSSVAEALASSAEHSERVMVKNHSDSLRRYAHLLKEIAEDATAGCGDPEKIELVRVTAGDVEKLTAQLTTAASDVVEDITLDNRSVRFAAVERMELVRREWATKVHLLTAVVDDLTSEVSSPVDRLAGAALAVSRSTGQQREKHMATFREQSAALRDRVAVVEERASAAVRDSLERVKVDQVYACTDEIVRLTPQVMAEARALAENPDQTTVERFQLLRRQWAGKAQLLVTTLDQIPDCDMSAASVAIQELLSPSHIASDLPGYPSSGLTFEEYNEASASARRHVQSSSPVFHGAFNSDEQFMTGNLQSTKIFGSDARPKSESPTKSFMSSSPQSVAPAFHPATRGRPVSVIETPTMWREMSQTDEDIAADLSSRSIQESARVLQDEVDQFEQGGNDFIVLANKMASQMFQMGEYTRGRGQLQSKPEMINTAKAIASNGNITVRYAQLIAERCVDKRMRADLQYYAEMIPTFTQQLRIISSVKAATPRDPSADVILVKNAQNLMHAVKKTMQAAEAACMKGLRDLGKDDAAQELAFDWKRKVYKERDLEKFSAPITAKGLRKLSRNTSAPSLSGYVK